MNPASLTLRLLQALGLGSVLLLAGCGKQEAHPPAALRAASSAGLPATPTSASTAAAPVRAITAVVATLAKVPASKAASVANRPAPASSAPPPFAFDKLAVGDAVGADHKVMHAADQFDSNDKSLYASVATVGSSSGATLNAKWSYLEGRSQLISSISQSIATDGPAITTFKVQNPDLWPEGSYKVEISINGKPVASQDFTIGKR
ncbi:MAG: hypothetical protein ABI386_12340 [Rhodanobacter sp.]